MSGHRGIPDSGRALPLSEDRAVVNGAASVSAVPASVPSAIEFVGYFDKPEQAAPTHNPCASAPCPACGETNGDDVLYRSLMPESGRRSYFFAFHKRCAGNPQIEAFEEAVMGQIFPWDDAAGAPS